MDKLEKTQIPAKMLLNPVHCFALGFGSGLVPRIPGTTGTLVGVLLFILMPDMDWITSKMRIRIIILDMYRDING